MKKLFIITLTLLSLHVSAQDTEAEAPKKPWKTSGQTALTFSQVNLSNWAAGGENSYSLNGLINLKAEYTKKKINWTNTLDLGYGIQEQGEQSMRKTDDRVDFMSKLGYKNGGQWYYSALLNFKTQMDVGYKYSDDSRTAISEFLAPAYLNIALGMEYKPNESFFLALAPAAGKITIVMDDTLSAQGAFGVDPGDNTRFEFGGIVKSTFQKDIMKNVNLLSKLDLFTNYAEKPQNIDVSWEVIITMKINEVLSASLQTHLLYDDDIKSTNDAGEQVGPKIQFKEVFGVGLAYKF